MRKERALPEGKAQITLRLPEDLHNELKKEAARLKISLNAVILLRLEPKKKELF